MSVLGYYPTFAVRINEEGSFSMAGCFPDKNKAEKSLLRTSALLFCPHACPAFCTRVQTVT
jgi:hypothetical protein